MDARMLVTRFISDDDINALALAIATGYRACAEFMSQSVVTGVFPIGTEQRPHMLRAFVDYALMRYADTRAGFYQEIRTNAANNCRHVRIYKNNLAITAHFMGRRRFRRMARSAVNRAALAARNKDLFGFESAEADVFADFGYAQMLHGGNSNPELLILAIPTRDQRGIAVATDLDIPAPDLVAAEQIREAMSFGLKNKKASSGEEDDDDGAEAVGGV
jgi:hypothetical protein